jgi:hypothetical protein
MEGVAQPSPLAGPKRQRSPAQPGPEGTQPNIFVFSLNFQDGVAKDFEEAGKF